jgi:hypothetical protein
VELDIKHKPRRSHCDSDSDSDSDSDRDSDSDSDSDSDNFRLHKQSKHGFLVRRRCRPKLSALRSPPRQNPVVMLASPQPTSGKPINY